MKKIFKHCELLLLSKLVIICLMLPACTDKFDEINTPKNQLPEDNINPALIGQAFAYSQYHGLNATYTLTAQVMRGDIYVQYFTALHTAFTTDQFVENGTWSELLWRDFYSKPAPQLLLTEQVTKNNNMQLANAIAKVWRVEIYHRMTDYYGPIIYKQFGNKQTSVPFDSQKDVYVDFFKTLDEAVEVLKQNPAGNAFGAHDQIYAGNADKWLKLANSLRLRLAVRLAYVDAALARSEAEKAITAGVITSNADNASVSSTANSANILSKVTYLSDFRASAGLISVLTGYNDPRLSEYYAPSVNGNKFIGLRNGLPSSERGSQLAPLYSFVGAKWVPNGRAGTTTPNRVISASEVAFLRAEGALRGWNMGGTAKDLYNSGISLSLTERTSATPGQITAYLTSTATPASIADKWNTPAMSNIPVLFDQAGSFERQLEQIITQKWIALYPDGWEAWAERRRTGYPRGYAIIKSENPDLKNTDLVRRVEYPPIEVSANTAAYNEAVGMLGGPDKSHTRLWWDKKPLSEYPIPTN